jgi:23S rRNA pseudouridine1911/1915/1917 synthase
VTKVAAVTRFVVAGTADRVDRLVAAHLGLGRRHARELVERGEVRVDGRPARPGSVAQQGSVVELVTTEVENLHAAPSDGIREKPRILWRDGTWLGVFKPVGYHSARGRGHPSLADFLASEQSDATASGPFATDVGLVHRLDRDTCGIVLATTESAAYVAARKDFAAGEIAKEYLALVVGRWVGPRTIDVPLARMRTRVRPARRGERARPAITDVVPIEGSSGWTLVAATMRTGVTHQIRAHLAFAGHPIVGDSKYGAPEGMARSHQLHARRITLPDGRSISASPGIQFLETLARMRQGLDRRAEDER